MAKTTTKADINFEQELWKAANELRGAVAENQYKDYVLPLIFLPYIYPASGRLHRVCDNSLF